MSSQASFKASGQMSERQAEEDITCPTDRLESLITAAAQPPTCDEYASAFISASSSELLDGRTLIIHPAP